jgi:hypothetical protein
MTLPSLRLAAATLGLLASTAFAQDAPAGSDCTDSGVWTGTVGGARVSMAFSDGGGRYYYGNHIDDLVLTRDPDHANRWLEADLHGKRTGALTLTCTDKLQGTWTNAAGAHAQPVAAAPFVFVPPREPDTDDRRRAADPEPEDTATDPEDAAVEAYLHARKSDPPAVRRQNERIGAHRYVAYGVHDLGATGIELAGPDRGLELVNGTLRPQYQAALAGIWACRYWALATGGPQAVANIWAGARVVLWRGTTVVVESWTLSCGREVMLTNREQFVFDTRTGERMSWPFPLAVLGPRAPPSRLMEAIDRLYPRSETGRKPECADFVERYASATAGPEQDEFVIELRRSGSKRDPHETGEPPDCDARLTLPLAEALPLLPEDRRKLLADLLARP